MLSKVCKERLEYFASLKGHVGQAVTMCRVELSDISTELLSLREQMEELNNLSPATWMDEKGNVCAADNRLRGLTAECADAYRKYDIPLFTAAKPVED